MIRLLTTAALSVAMTSAAQAGFFSFASDANRDGPTFQGLGLNVRDGGQSSLDGSVNVLFRYDADEDGPNPSIDIAARMELNARIRDYARPAFSSLSIHSYLASGSYSFFEARTGDLILRVEFSKAAFTSVSTAEGSWGATANIIADEKIDPALAFIAGPALGGGVFNANKNFNFTLTGLRTAVAGADVPVAGTSGEATERWISEGSWSARAIPAPAGIGALSVVGLLAARRRR